jgi:flagellar basal body-associated protein FliL
MNKKLKNKKRDGEFSDKIIFIMLIVLIVTSVFSLGLYALKSSSEPVEATNFQDQQLEETANGAVTLEIVRPPPDFKVKNGDK